MIVGEIVLAGRDWLWWALPLAATALVVLTWSYGRTSGRVGMRLSAGLLKVAGIVALAICLIEPLFSGTRPRPKSNLFLLVADNSRSLQVHDRTSAPARGQELKQRLAAKTAWRTRLEQDFDVRSYSFDARLEPLKDFDVLKFDGDASAMAGSLTTLDDRFAGRPVAGILLFTDGNATDVGGDTAWHNLPPVYPVTIGSDAGLADVAVSRVSVSQTNFEAAPVTIAAEIECQGLAGKSVAVRVLDESRKDAAAKVIEHQTIRNVADGKPIVARFELRPERPGISFYTVQAAIEGEEKFADAPEKSAEATLANNRRLALVDRGGGPYRVLYVSGRPNWEFKFLRRALDQDDEVDLVGLVRIAKKEPKFTFRGRPGERTNPLFRGFGNQNDEEAEQYDEPVLIRLGKVEVEKEELKGGFPKSAEDLFRYHALVVDDVESAFFTHEQMSLIQRFVSQRGGGFLMLGGHSSFAKGKYQRTPVSELLPIYLDRGQRAAPAEGYRLQLTRDGWLQPWVRLRSTEDEENKRLATMPSFLTVSHVGTIKPGAAVLASVQSTDGQTVPALVAQQFGRGRAAALAIGDLWRWNLKRPEGAESDLEKAWRQTVRWLVADVPQPVEVETQPARDDPSSPVRISVRVRDRLFEPLDNASVTLRVTTPEGREIELTAEASEQAAGQYETSFASHTPGAYRAVVTAKAEDTSEVGQREAGWTVEPAADELRRLKPNRELLSRIAQATGGEMIAADGLDDFVSSLPNRKIPVTEAWTYPLWHQWPVFLFAMVCLVGEWGLRRWNGLP